MKNLLFILFVAALVSAGCKAQSEIVFKSLTQGLSDELKMNKKVKCEQYIMGSMKYKRIEDIEKRKLNKLKREAKKCGCNIVYLDFGNYLGAAYEGDFVFFAICVDTEDL